MSFMASAKYPRCIHCSKHLSHFPIYLCDNGTDSVCGRCYNAYKLIYEKDEHSKLIVNKPFEELASTLMFPCINPGCPQLLLPKDVHEHEATCSFKQVSCFLSKNMPFCGWTGRVENLVDHVEYKHNSNMLSKPEIAWKPYVYKNVNAIFKALVDDEERHFLLKLRNVGNEYFTTEVIYLKTESSFMHTLKCRYNGNDNVIYRNQKCLKSLDENDPIVTTWATFNDRIKYDTDDDTKYFHLSIIVEENQNTNGNLNYELLTEIECPVCYDYMAPPIYQCILGHSFCNNCNTKNMTCPCCRKNIHGTRNFPLEAISNKINHPCKYSSNKCQFFSKAGKTKAHETMCKFGPYKCPLSKDIRTVEEDDDDDASSTSSHDKHSIILQFQNCLWTGDHDSVLDHIKDAHSIFFIENYKIDVTLDDDYKTEHLKDCFIAKFFDKLFRLCFKHFDKTFFWCVQYIGPIEEVEEYKFNLEIIDNSNNGGYVSLKGDCSVFKTDFDITQSDVFLTFRQVEKLIAKDVLSFKFEVTKKMV